MSSQIDMVLRHYVFRKDLHNPLYTTLRNELVRTSNIDVRVNKGYIAAQQLNRGITTAMMSSRCRNAVTPTGRISFQVENTSRKPSVSIRISTRQSAFTV